MNFFNSLAFTHISFFSSILKSFNHLSILFKAHFFHKFFDSNSIKSSFEEHFINSSSNIIFISSIFSFIY